MRLEDGTLATKGDRNTVGKHTLYRQGKGEMGETGVERGKSKWAKFFSVTRDV